MSSDQTTHAAESMSVARQPSRTRPLYEAYKRFTHGGNYWRDQYQLEHWHEQMQPVVYRGEKYHGYDLLKRVGSWCWLTKDPKTGEFLTIKFLPRDGNDELGISQYITKHCRSPFVSTLRDSFTIPHHLSKNPVVHPKGKTFSHIFFQALVYPATGTCLGRCADVMEKCRRSPDIPFTLQRRQTYVGQVVEGLCALHRIGVVHGDIHLGNVVLAPPSDDHLTRLLARPPLEDEIRTITGELPPPWMPHLSTEPEDIGFTPSSVRIIDFGFSFRAKKNTVYGADRFPTGTPPPPELLIAERQTDWPFKVDSWYLGHVIYAILTDQPHFVSRAMSGNKKNLLNEYRLAIAALKRGEDEAFNELPEDVRSRYLPILLGLLEYDPQKRLSVEEVRAKCGVSK